MRAAAGPAPEVSPRPPRGRPLDRSATIRSHRTVLVAVRTETTLHRILDVLPVFAGDPRVELAFTVVPGSDFGGRLPAALDRLGTVHLPWSQAVRTRFNLALAASPNGPLHRLRAPLVLVPHGAGFNKRLAGGRRGSGDEPDASGLSARQLEHRGRVTAAAIGLAHPDQMTRLATACPKALPRARIIGDPCLDRMLAGVRWRERYRAAFGVRPGRRLTVVASTWGPRSLYGVLTDLPGRLLAELPYDDHRVALVLHPNVWARHGEWQIRHWLAGELAAGLVLLPPEEGWRAALVAADCVVADHGSLALYAAALDRPVLLTGTGDGEVVAGSPLTDLAALAPRLDPALPLRGQVEGVVADHKPGSLQRACDRAFSLVGGSTGALRTLLYGMLELSEPPGEAVPPAPPVPRPARETASALLVRARVTPGTVRLERFPVSVRELAPRDCEPPSDTPPSGTPVSWPPGGGGGAAARGRIWSPTRTAARTCVPRRTRRCC
ncbi:translation initiation factor 2 [Streptomyces sp. MST-110588]|uniref:translation initiation factor 2 n=1 Tax=Streptomyces sp. MST-110588 TaxID=2833628 RepID=UPI001F5D76B9|nr:translation initiation factor 2 [Streptomyces sp. MST-110588]UNO43139.1 translation initiation factor 2 [Streptomyces sp. MST-110588]